MSFLRKYKWFRRLCGGHWHYNKINEDLWWSNGGSGWSRNFYMPRTEYFITETNYYEKTAIITLKTEIWDNGYDKSYRKKKKVRTLLGIEYQHSNPKNTFLISFV
jgi:hypothetical protein